MPSSFDVNAKVNLDPRSLTASSKKIEMALGRITGQASEFQKSLDASTARVFAFGATTAVLNGVNQAFKKLVSTTIEVQKRLVEINSIFQATEKTFNRFRNAIFQVAKDTGQAFGTVAEGAAELARQGLSAEETAKRLKASLVLTRISGLGAEKSVKALTAAINGFTSAGLTANQIVNKMVAVDTAFAVSAQDLAEAFSRAGSTAEDAGVSFDQLLGLVTAVEQKTARGGAVIGNAFKSIFTRLSRGSTIESLKELGVEIDATQSGIQKLSALSRALENISDPTVASAIKELAGGVFQINVVSAALKDLSADTSIFAGAAKIASEATNEAFQKNALLNQTISAQINTLIQGLTSLAERIGSITFGPLLENLIGLTTKFTEFLDKALDPEKGNQFIKGFFGAIGTFLSGPAVVIFTTAFVKIFALVAKFAKDGLKAVFAIGSESSKIKNIEAGIVGLLQRDKGLRDIIVSTTVTQAQKEGAVISAIKAENALLTHQATLMNSIAGAAMRRGVGGFSQTSGKFKFASGFQQEEAMARGLGATGGVKAHYGEGTIGGRKFIMNNQEMEIPRFGGGRDSAVIPMYPMGYPAGTGSAAGLSKKRRGTKRGGKGTLLLDGSSFGLLSALSGTVPSVSTTSINTLSGISKKGITAAGIPLKSVKQVQLSGLNVSSLDKGKKNFKSQYQNQVTKSFAAPLINFGAKMVGETFSNNDKRDITNKLKKQKSTKLFSSSTEGGIFESALRMVMAGSRASSAFKGTNERAPFDFEEKGSARRPFVKRFFPNRSIARADAKRTADKDSARSFIHKILQDEKARGLARPRLAAGGHIPKYAKGSGGSGGSGGRDGGGAFMALFVLDSALKGLGVGVDKVTGEMDGLGKAINSVIAVASSVSMLQMMGVGGIGTGIKSIGSKGKSFFGGGMWGKDISSKGLRNEKYMKLRGKGLHPKAAFWHANRQTAGSMRSKIGSGLNRIGQGVKGSRVGRGIAGMGRSVAGSSTAMKASSLLRGAPAFAAKAGVGLLRFAGPIGLAIGATMLASKLGNKLGDAIFKSGIEKGQKKLNQGDRLGILTRASESQKSQFTGVAGKKGQDLFDKRFGNIGGVNAAFVAYETALSKSAAASKNEVASLEDKIKAQEALKKTLQKLTGMTAGSVSAFDKSSKALARLEPLFRKYSRQLKSRISKMMHSAAEGTRMSGLASERGGIMQGLTLGEGPNAEAVAARIGVGSANAQAGSSLSALRALQAEQANPNTSAERLAELPKEIKDAGAAFRSDVIEGAVTFKNNITAINAKLKETITAQRELTTQRGASNISKIGRFAQVGGVMAGKKEFEALQKALEKSKGVDETRRIINQAITDPRFKNAADAQGLDVEKMITLFMNRGATRQGVAGKNIENAANVSDFGDTMKELFKDAAGANFDEQAKQLSSEVADLSNALSENKQGLKDFLGTFNTDTAKGVVTLVENISTDLNSSVTGLTKVGDATKLIDGVNKGVTELATNTATLVSTAAGNIAKLQTKVDKMATTIAGLKKTKTGGVQSPEVPAPVE